MRGVLVVALAAVIVLPAAASPSAGPASAVRVADFTPFSVRGKGFRAKERVRVVAQVEGRHVKTVVAGANGTFTVRFAGVSLPACAGYFVRATGSKGSRAYLRHVPECPAD